MCCWWRIVYCPKFGAVACALHDDAAIVYDVKFGFVEVGMAAMVAELSDGKQ